MIKLVRIVSDHTSYFLYINNNEYQNVDVRPCLSCFLISQYLDYDIGKEWYGRIVLYDIQDDRFVFFRKRQIHDYRNDVTTLNVHNYISFPIISTPYYVQYTTE